MSVLEYVFPLAVSFFKGVEIELKFPFLFVECRKLLAVLEYALPFTELYRTKDEKTELAAFRDASPNSFSNCL